MALIRLRRGFKSRLRNHKDAYSNTLKWITQNSLQILLGGSNPPRLYASCATKSHRVSVRIRPITANPNIYSLDVERILRASWG